jgi:hypothetical protein
MRVPAAPWRPWTVAVPCALALAWCGLLMIADGFGAVMASWDTPFPRERLMVTAGLAGHCVLAVASAALLVIGLRSQSRRQPAALTAWLIIPAGLGWLMLVGRLAGYS